jgi:hypothetical protein
MPAACRTVDSDGKNIHNTGEPEMVTQSARKDVQCLYSAALVRQGADGKGGIQRELDINEMSS